MTMLDYAKLTPMVKRAAGIAGRSFPDHYDQSDTEQALWVWCLENSPTVKRLVSEGSEGALMQLLLSAANAHLRNEDAAAYRYAPEQEFYYSTDLIGEILEVIYSHEDWQSFAISYDAMPRAKNTDPRAAGNTIASYIDVKSAVERLNVDQQAVLARRYRDKWTMQLIGDELGITRQAATKRLDAAVRAVREELGRRPLSELRNPPETASRPSGIAAARAVTDRSYEG